MSANPAAASARRILADVDAVGWSDAHALTHILRTSLGMAGVWNRAEETAWYSESEWRHVAAKLEALYARQRAGDESAYTRAHVERWEAVLAALQGYPDSLTQ